MSLRRASNSEFAAENGKLVGRKKIAHYVFKNGAAGVVFQKA